MQSLLLTTLLLASTIKGLPNGPLKVCREYTIPVNATSFNLVWNHTLIQDNQEIAAFNTEWGRRDAASTFQPAYFCPNPESNVYTTSGTFCEPASGGNSIVLLATHGGGYDRHYWDPMYQPGNYSFVDYALARGYSVFYYDRLGLGKSEIVSGYVSQVAIQAPILTELVKLMRAGQFSRNPPSKVVLLGHSFGSVVSNAVIHSHPELVDAALLTGLAYNGSAFISSQSKQLRIANLHNPQKFSKLDNGYAVWVDIFANIENFFKAPFYDFGVVQWAQNNQQPTGLLETLSSRYTNVSSPNFDAPILLMSGEYDFIVCGGYCPGVLDELVAEVFPASAAAGNLVTYIQPGSGHAINLSLNAT